MIPIIPPQQQTQLQNNEAENNSEEFCDNVTKTRESDKLHSEKNPTPSNEAPPIIIETTVVPPSPPSSTQPLEGGQLSNQHRKVSTSSPASSPKRPRMLGPQSPGNGHHRPKIHNSNWPRTNNMQPAMNIDFSLMSKPPPGGGVTGHAHQQQRGYNNQARTYYNRNQNPPHRGGYQRHGGGGYHSQQPLNKNVKDSNS